MSETSHRINESRSAETVSFREYKPGDFCRCVEITASGWPILLSSIHTASVDWYLGSATWKDVACVSGMPVGVLFGKVNSELTISRRLRSFLAHLMVYLRLLLGLYGRLPNRLTYIRTGISEDRRVESNVPMFDGEITFFAVDQAYRGRGIGKELMTRFVNYARHCGARKIFVYTTNPGSDWEFYDRYGFAKYSSFRDSFMTFAMKKEVTGIIYALNIGEESQACNLDVR